MDELKKTLTAWRGTALMLNIVLGAGLLTLPGLAERAAGGSALLVWAACALAAAPLLAVFAILGRTFPSAGGLAAILGRAFGSFGYTAATLLFLGAVVFGLPAIALAGGYYAASMLGGPAHLYAALLLVSAVLANVISSELAGRLNALIASFLVIVLVLIAVIGLISVQPQFSQTPMVTTPLPGIDILGLTFMMVFFAFTGWEVGANLSGEFKNPRRDFPIAMALSFVVAVALYGALAIVAHYADLQGAYEAPFSALFQQKFGAMGGMAVAAVSVLLIFANLSAAVWAVSRMVYSAAQEGLLPGVLTTVHQGTPYRAVLVTVSALLLVTLGAWFGWFRLDHLLALAGQNFLLLYAGAAAALLRLSDRSAHRVLALVSLIMVAGLIIARGAEGMVYPGILIVTAFATSKLRGHSTARHFSEN